MLDFDWLVASVFFTYSNLFSSFQTILQVFQHCRWNCLKFPFLPWYLPFWILLFTLASFFLPLNYSNMTLHKDSSNGYKYIQYNSCSIMTISTFLQSYAFPSPHELASRESFNKNLFSVIKQIYHIMESRKEKVKRFSPSGSGNFSPLTGIFFFSIYSMI